MSVIVEKMFSSKGAIKFTSEEFIEKLLNIVILLMLLQSIENKFR